MEFFSFKKLKNISYGRRDVLVLVFCPLFLILLFFLGFSPLLLIGGGHFLSGGREKCLLAFLSFTI
ncbi:hypothetical protein A2J05_01475 [Fusobacterium necrophorum subsp. funduliforme]|uniref:Uncharacterized protein n=3 Tax=Fusobacterium necrophorum TaxID=859 RepID=A0A0B4E4G1_9FUSO|nr:hypothetical protein EGX98_03300 [Fusobacterium necrophorum]KDE61605.1 hypothetical protein FUSO5_11265 [Fusobacterium necrophorum BFTR-1]KDE65128.1 hypothetical protein FUSO3_01750 [Fusobacterium necrophorum BL]KDE69299.1 hypothetical protein FUSO8_11895 [Fusobacterium necrophorum DJ-2]KDE71552.1 hypothetical protein FUSO6_00185 [Fusobacterium necrophorum DAB]KID48328.1 hypothetical protein C095_10305 [Fusobacterium necrophorum subsp. funduliforme B35]KYL02573.1 hypothetical protein A2J05